MPSHHRENSDEAHSTFFVIRNIVTDDAAVAVIAAGLPPGASIMFGSF
jgi:hypothetical protein